MHTTARIRGAEVLCKTRAAWAREGGADGRYSNARVRKALKRRERDGWVVALPASGDPGERLSILWHTHPMAAVAGEYAGGTRWFDRARLENALGKELDSRAGADALAAVGFALTGASDTRVEILAADPRTARLVNRARLGPQSRGYDIHTVVEALLGLRRPPGRRCVVTEKRRWLVATLLAEAWAIDSDHLWDGRACVRLCSRWTLGPPGNQPVPPEEPRG